MKLQTKRWFAAALVAMGMGTAAQAQDSVTLYGVVDTSVEAVHASGTSRPAGAVPTTTRQVSNSSLWGLRGKEELGAGLSAFFQIEYGFNTDVGSAPAARDQFVGLRSDRLGMVQMGLLTTPMRGLGGRFNFMPGSTSIANNIGIMTTLNGVQTNLNARLANAIQYTSPELPGGMTGQLVYSFGEDSVVPFNRTDSTARPLDGMYAWGLGLRHERGPLYVAYAYETRRGQALPGAGAGLSGAASLGMGVAAAGASNDYEHRLVVRYEGQWLSAGATSVSAGWDRLGSKGSFGAGAAAGSGQTYRDAFSVSVMQKVGAQDFIASYSVARPLHCSGAAQSGPCSGALRPDTGAQQLVLAYHYWLSKRTMLQAYVSRIHNGAAATYDFDVNPTVSSVASRAPGNSPTGVGFGIRHSF